MEQERNFILKKGSKLRSISNREPMANPDYNIYFHSASEALLSIYKAPINNKYYQLSAYGPDKTELYINTFALKQDIVVKEYYGKLAKRVNDLNFTISDQIFLINKDCVDLNSSENSVPGYVISYNCSLIINTEEFNEDDIFLNSIQYVEGRLTGYVICNPDLLIHVASFKITLPVLYEWLQSFAFEYNNPRVDSRFMVRAINVNPPELKLAYFVAEFENNLDEISNDALQRVFITPWALEDERLQSRQFSPSQLSTIPLPISPKSPEYVRKVFPLYPIEPSIPVTNYDP